MSFIGGSLLPTAQRWYPDNALYQAPCTFGDLFRRESLAPTSAWTLYTVANNGGGTASIQDAQGRMRLTTSAGGAGEDVDVRTSGWAVMSGIASIYGTLSLPTRMNTKTMIQCSTGTAIEGFVGLVNSYAALSALPTTGKHLGLTWDASTSANFFLTSADGSTQTTTDTTQAIGTGIFILEMNWTSLNTATLNFRNSSTNAVIATQAVTAIGSPADLSLHWFVQTEAAAAKSLNVYYWYTEFT